MNIKDTQPIDVSGRFKDAATGWGLEDPEVEPVESPGNSLVLAGDFGKAIEFGRLEGVAKSYANESVDIAASVAAEETNLVVDITKVAGKMGHKFAIAPAQYELQQVTRHRDCGDGEVLFTIGGRSKNPGQIKMEKWKIRFEPGVVVGRGEYPNRTEGWVSSKSIVPPVPNEHRPENLDGHFIIWEQNWQEKLIVPKDPALLEHIVGDVYRVAAVWDITPLEAAALRGNR